MALDNLETSSAEEARKHGNELAVQARELRRSWIGSPQMLTDLFLLPAEAAYKKAVLLAPDDPTPFSNLSSDLIKIGDDDAAAAITKMKTLYERLVKSYLHESRLDDAQKVVDEISDEKLSESVRNTLATVESWASLDIELHRKLVFDRLPRFQAHFQLHTLTSSRRDDVAEYYAFGHDYGESLFDEGLEKEMTTKKRLFKNIHITLLNLKPAAIARTLIHFDLMTLFGLMKSLDGPAVADLEDAPILIAYLYVGHIIPTAVNERLQTQIGRLITSLETDESIANSFFLPPFHSERAVRRVINDRNRRSRMRSMMATGFVLGAMDEHIPKGFETDRKTFDDLAVLLPSREFAERRDPPLVALMQQCKETEYIDANWVTNPTLFDIDHASDEDWKVLSIEADPLEVAAKLLGPPFKAGQGVMEYTASFFTVVSLSLVKISDHLMVEALVGEMTDVMDLIRWNCLDARSQPSGGIDPSGFPRTYDRIHMSNIPDYIGGLFTAAMYGRPLLRPDRQSNLRLNNLPPMFESHEHLQSHTSISSLTRASPVSHEHLQSHASISSLTRASPVSHEHLQSEYLLTYGKKRIADHFSLPYIAPAEWSDRPVYSPLNLTALLRFICQLSKVGYHAHWLSGVLSALCAGTITTTARPPRQEVTSPADVDAKCPALESTVAPWRAELTTLVSIWSRLLPFGLVLPQQEGLVSPSDIAKLTVRFSSVRDQRLRMPHFVLLFWDSTDEDQPSSSMRRLLRDDEQGDKTSALGKKKREGVHVFTTMKYFTATKIVSFWCRADVMQRMMKGDSKWKVFIWRVDNWTQMSEGVDVKDGVTKTRVWI
ncbi:hypothetical protein B0H66DRAFT_585518 [Apodospora peruviana]|uniref:Uncharacterized protein n=1 Tax=Apodospora peruviana TaxID=516989 RepID=A0AAE0IPG2_9PEZI|nr:hypothetical protein B0H66DRAFT_585518 [Apodospora peruviana]